MAESTAAVEPIFSYAKAAMPVASQFTFTLMEQLPTLVEPISAKTIREREIASEMKKVDEKKRMAF